MSPNVQRELAEWPDVLKLNAAAARLASAVYYAKAEAFGGETRNWDALDVATRHRYTERAAELLKTLQPKSITIATGLRTATSKIIGGVFPNGVR